MLYLQPVDENEIYLLMNGVRLTKSAIYSKRKKIVTNVRKKRKLMYILAIIYLTLI